MWRTLIIALLCFSSALAQNQDDVSSSDVLPVKAEGEADKAQIDTYQETEDDLWAEDEQDNYEYDWDSWDTDKEAGQSVELEDRTADDMPAVDDTSDKEQVVPEPDYESSFTHNTQNWQVTYDDLNDGQAGDYSSEEEEQYPADLSEFEDVKNWPNAEEEDYSEDMESSEETDKPTPTPQLEEYGPSMMVEGRKRGVFTVWHYAIFGIAGAIFILGILIIVGAAIKAARRPSSSYRRLADPVKV